MTFQERTKLAMEALSRKSPVTLEQAKEQAQRIESRISPSGRKRANIKLDKSADTK